MSTQTITEALAEIKTITARLIKKREFIVTYIARQAVVRDPLTNQGGSDKAIAAERQSIIDLEARAVALRLAINQSNFTTQVTVQTPGGSPVTQSVAWWLTWRRDVAPARQQANAQLRARLQALRQQAQREGMTLHSASGVAIADPQDRDVVVNVDELELNKEAEELEAVLGQLDGQLSLKNATVTVTIG